MYSFRLALRYLKPRRSFLSVVNLLCVLGILLGVGTLIVVIAVMSGFDDMWKEKLLTFTPHIIIGASGTLPDSGPLYAELEADPDVLRAEPFVEGLVVVDHRGQTSAPFIRGIDPDRNQIFSGANRTNLMAYGRYSLEDEEAMLGVDLAFALGVRPGSEITVFAPQSLAGEDELRLPDELVVSGIFEVGMYQIDEQILVTSLETARDLLNLDDREAHGIQLTLAEPARAHLVAQRLRDQLGFNFRVRTWMEMNQALFGALQVEKRMMFFLLAIISVVASFMIMSTLITITVQKTREIGLLKAVGFDRLQILATFLWYGLIQGLLGILLGNIAGLLVLHYRNDILNFVDRTFKAELLPKELYFLSELPARINPSDLLAISGTVLVMSLLAGLVPAWIAAAKPPVEALRYE